MDLKKANDAVMRRVQAINDRVNMLKEHDLYFYNQPVEEIKGVRVARQGRARLASSVLR